MWWNVEQLEPGAVVSRVAPSFIRFGSFELPLMYDDGDMLRELAMHTVNTHFPDIAESGASDSDK